MYAMEVLAGRKVKHFRLYMVAPSVQPQHRLPVSDTALSACQETSKVCMTSSNLKCKRGASLYMKKGFYVNM
jgi:hypothetical protein